MHVIDKEREQQSQKRRNMRKAVHDTSKMIIRFLIRSSVSVFLFFAAPYLSKTRTDCSIVSTQQETWQLAEASRTCRVLHLGPKDDDGAGKNWENCNSFINIIRFRWTKLSASHYFCMSFWCLCSVANSYLVCINKRPKY